ncbi:MAG: BadF/BadG/BcrA/BcrD ATPase family protein [Gammaproteobacteria bacterium]|nr:BadF/BadG/BcrA/BcrD ATPase family protein [Gammaproteobacteria bacterium]
MDQYDILIGVDGGGTKTKVEIEDGLGKKIGAGQGGPANIRSSVPVSWQSIQQAVAQALVGSSIRLDDPTYRFHIGLGLAGTEVPEAAQTFLKVPHPYHSLILNSDAYVACLGVHGGKDGAIIIIGTGTIGYQITKGEATRVGGWGFPHSDEGGGAWLGMELCRLTFQWLDRRIKPSPLLEAVYAHFNHDIYAFSTWANRASPGQFGELVPLLISFIEQQDPHALDLIKQSAKCINSMWHGLECQTKKKLPYCLLGGIAPFVEPYLDRRFRARLVPRQFNAPQGAIFMLQQHLLSKEVE